MNLSEWLDEARAKRERGLAPDLEPSPYDLRMKVDERTYDGTDLRSGQRLTRERWEQLRQMGPQGLPKWRPKKAAAEPPAAHPSPVARQPAAPAAAEPPAAHPSPVGGPADVLQLPAWARGVSVYTPLTSGRPADVDGSDPEHCPTCGSEGRITHVDLIDDTARLECARCGFRWSYAASELTRSG